MGKVGKGVNCSVSGCKSPAERSISRDQIGSSGLSVSGDRRAFLCHEHYKVIAGACKCRRNRGACTRTVHFSAEIRNHTQKAENSVKKMIGVGALSSYHRSLLVRHTSFVFCANLDYAVVYCARDTIVFDRLWRSNVSPCCS